MCYNYVILFLFTTFNSLINKLRQICGIKVSNESKYLQTINRLLLHKVTINFVKCFMFNILILFMYSKFYIQHKLMLSVTIK